MKSKYIFLLLFFLLPSVTAWNIFGVDSPPGIQMMQVCIKNQSCNITMPLYFYTDIFMNGFAIYNVTFVNATFNSTLYINSTQVLNPIWVNKTGDIMTGDLTIESNDVDNNTVLTIDSGFPPVNNNASLVFKESGLSRWTILYEGLLGGLHIYNDLFDTDFLEFELTTRTIRSYVNLTVDGDITSDWYCDGISCYNLTNMTSRIIPVNGTIWNRSGSNIWPAVLTDYVALGHNNPDAPLDIYTSDIDIAQFRNHGQDIGFIIIDADNTKDTQIHFQESTATVWSIGNDGSDNMFKWRYGAGSTGAFDVWQMTLSQYGNLWINGTLNTTNISSQDGTIDINSNVDVGRHNITINGSIFFEERSGIQNIFYINPVNGDGFNMAYWYDFEMANDDWLVFQKTDGNDNMPDGGIAFMMSNASGFNKTVLKMDGYGNVNFTDQNITTTGNMYGQPLTGMLGSGIIWANGTNEFAEVNLSCVGLTCSWNAFKVRLVNTSNHVSYCEVARGNYVMTNNQHSVLYIDKTCTIREASIQTYIQTLISPGGIADFGNVIMEGGNSYNSNGIGLENKRIIKLRKLLLQSSGQHLSIVSGFVKQQNEFLKFNITSGQYVYLMDIVSSTFANVTTNKIEFLYHTAPTTWVGVDQYALNITHCDDGTAIVPCTTGTGSNTKYRRHFIYMIGYNDSGVDYTQLHQTAPLLNTFYASTSACLDIINNPIVFNLPSFYQYGAVPLYFYCARANDVAWVSTNWYDLRTVQSASASSGGSVIDTSIFILTDGTRQLTGNWDAGSYNITMKRLTLTPNTTGVVCNEAIAGMIYYDNITHKHYGCNASTWNAFY